MEFSDHKNEFIEKLNEGEVFFFAGSGVSYLSSMPSAGKILMKTADLFLPQDEEHRSLKEMIIQSEDNYTIQPELLYENLLYIIDSIDVLTLWKSFSPEYLKSFKYPVVPNINHLFIVEYSVKNSVPLFTTNFDCLFEEAAQKLGYNTEVILPFTVEEEVAIADFQLDTIKKDTVYIFKLHGTISDNETQPLVNLHTTMTSISKANFQAIDFLELMCTKKNIVFTGYSGKDIDYFPEIKKRSLDYAPFWIDEFGTNDLDTKANCIYINGNPVICYPDVIFEKVRRELKVEPPNINKELSEEVFKKLQEELLSKIKVEEKDKKLILGQLVKEVGNYKHAYKYLKALYSEHNFSLRKKVILLLSLSNLAHENSEFESSKSFAKKALKISKQESTLETFSLRALFQISESKRMLIPHNTHFSYKAYYLDYFRVLLSFLKNELIANLRIDKFKKLDSNNIEVIFLIHDAIEHRIRFFALLQAFFLRISDEKDFWLFEFLKNWFIKKWQKIRVEAFEVGYSHGKANTFKYETRINKHFEKLDEGTHIYDLTKYETGRGLAFKNIAENKFREGNYEEAKKNYLKFYESGLSSGNKLNAIKGLLGIAKINMVSSNQQPLKSKKLKILKTLINNIEGKKWQKHFSRVLKEIED